MADWRRYLELNNLHSRFREWKPLHWCWWFQKHGLPIPPYLIGGPSNTVQQTFRFRNDDGSESAATFMGSGNGEDQSIAVDTKFRIRFVIEETNGGTDNCAATLYYSYNSGTYTDVATTGDHIRAIASDYDPDPSDDQELTVARLGYSGTFENGYFDSDGVATTAATIDADNTNYTEFEFCLIIPSGVVSNGDTIDLRVYDNGVALNGGYTDTPRITVSVPVVDRDVIEADGITAADAPTLTALVLPNLSEADGISIADSPALEMSDLDISASDAITLDESQSVSTADLAISVSDSLTITDSRYVFFADYIITHDDGTFSEYTTSSTGGGDLSITAPAALNGTAYGLDAVVNDTGAIYGQLSLVGPFDRLYVKAHFDPVSTTGWVNGETSGFIYFSLSPSPYHCLAIGVRYYTATGFVIRFKIYDDGGTSYENEYAITNAPHTIEAVLVQSATVGAAHYYIDGVYQGSRTGLDNYDVLANVYRARVGANNHWAVNTSSVEFYIDEITISRLNVLPAQASDSITVADSVNVGLTGGTPSIGVSDDLTVADSPSIDVWPEPDPQIGVSDGVTVADTLEIVNPRTYYVRNGGSDGASGLSDTDAWATLGRLATQQLYPGDTGCLKCDSVWTGETLYVASNENGTEDHPITFTSYGGGAMPEVGPPPNTSGYQLNCAYTNGSDWIVFDGIHFTGAKESAVRLYEGSQHCTVQNCEMDDCAYGVKADDNYSSIIGNYVHALNMAVNTSEPSTDDRGATGVLLYGSNNLVEGNTFYDCIAESYDYGYDGGGVEIYAHTSGAASNNIIRLNWFELCCGYFEVGGDTTGQVHDCVFEHNVVVNCTRGYFHLAGGFSADVDNFKVENNTFYEDGSNPKTGTQYVIAFNGTPISTDVLFRGNIVILTDGDYDVSDENGYTHTYNSYYLTNGAGHGSHVNDATEDDENPAVLDAAGDDFRLDTTSPCINASIDLGYTVDYVGNAIPSNGGYDRGAYEHAGVVVSDGATVADDPTVSLGALGDFEVNVSDGVTVADSRTVSLDDLVVSESDAVTTGESRALVLPDLGVSEQDSVTAGESQALSIGDSDISKQEDVTVGESQVVAVSDLEIGEQDSVAVADSPEVGLEAAGAFEIDVSDSIAVADAHTVQLDDLAVFESDTVIVAESFSQSVDDLALSVSDGVVVSESQSLVHVKELSAGDNVGVGERFKFYSDAIWLHESISISIVTPGYYSVVESDGLTVADSASVTVSDPQISESDAITAADAPTIAIGDLQISQSDGITVSESHAVVLADLAVSESDGITVADLPATSLNDLEIAESEAVTVGEYSEVSLPELGAINISKSDAVTVADSPSLATSDLETSEQDDITVGEYVELLLPELGAISVSESDSITVADSASLTIGDLEISKSDGLIVGESDAENVELEVSKTDGLTVGEAHAVAIADLAISESDGVVVSEAQDLLTEPLDISVSDGLTVGEYREVYVTVEGVLYLSKADAVTAADTPTLITSDPQVSAAEALVVGESAVVRLEIDVAESDVVVVAGSVAIGSIGIEATAVDSVTVSDAAALTISDLEIARSDDITVADSPSLSVPEPGAFLVVESDNITVSDSPALYLGESLSVTDSVTASDAANVSIQEATPRSVSVSDDITVSDSIDARLEIFAAAADGLVLGEYQDFDIVTPDTHSVTVSDTIVVGEQISALGSLPGVSVADGLSVSDALLISKWQQMGEVIELDSYITTEVEVVSTITTEQGLDSSITTLIEVDSEVYA